MEEYTDYYTDVPPVPNQLDVENRLDRNGQAYLLACNYIYGRIQKECFYWLDYPLKNDNRMESNRFKDSLQAVCDDCERKYSEVLRDMVESLRITPTTLYGTFWGICDEVFMDGISWGRICALYTFAGSLAVECANLEMPQLIGKVALWLACYIQEYLLEWIEQHFGWDGLIEFQKAGNPAIKYQTNLSQRSLRMMLGLGITVGIGLTFGAILGGRA